MPSSTNVKRQVHTLRQLPLSDKMVRVIAGRFALMADPARIRLLQLLEHGEASVNDLAHWLGTAQPNVSKHLKLLRDGGIVSSRRNGRFMLYKIADPMVFKLCQLVCKSAADQARKAAHELLRERRASRVVRRSSLSHKHKTYALP